MKEQGQEQWAEITASTKKIKLDWIMIDNTKSSSYLVPSTLAQLYAKYDLPNDRACNGRKVMSRQHMMSSRKLRPTL